MQKRILLVLSETPLCGMYSRLLARKGYIPVFFPHPEPAQAFFEAQITKDWRHNLALFDFDFPRAALFGPTRRMAQANRKGGVATPFLGLTKNPAIGENDGRAIGIPKILPKPMSPGDLLALVATYAA